MDRNVTVRYFQLESIGDDPVSFEDAVNRAMQSGRTARQRARQIAQGVWLRLERRRMRGDLLTGEVVREQRENIPPEAADDGLIPLGIGGLGHSIAFAYDPLSRVIAIQFDPRGVSLGRFIDYLTAINRHARFRYETIISDDAWDRYNRGDPRSLSFTIAAPQNLDIAAGDGSVLSISKRLAQISDGPIVTVQVSMGQVRQHNLSRRFVSDAIRMLTQGDAAERVSSVKVRSKPEGLPADEIDFVKDFARDRDELTLPSDDHDENYRRRLAFVIRSFEARLDGIRDAYA